MGHRQSDSYTGRALQQQSAKLEAILELKTQQLNQNLESYRKAKEGKKQLEREVL